MWRSAWVRALRECGESREGGEWGSGLIVRCGDLTHPAALRHPCLVALRAGGFLQRVRRFSRRGTRRAGAAPRRGISLKPKAYSL
jgi:hypothetical protein